MLTYFRQRPTTVPILPTSTQNEAYLADTVLQFQSGAMNQYHLTWHTSVWWMNGEMAGGRLPSSTDRPPGFDLPCQLWPWWTDFRLDKVTVLLIFTNVKLHHQTNVHMVDDRHWTTLCGGVSTNQTWWCWPSTIAFCSWYCGYLAILL